MRKLALKVGFVLALYVGCVVLFYASNVAAILALRGPAPLTWDVLRFLFVRDALVSIPITIVAAVLWPMLRRQLRP